MAAEEEYLTYEQVLQELQTNRGQMNQFIRSGRLKQQVVEGETRFRKSEVMALKGELEKEPTVMEEWGEEAEESGTHILDESGQAPAEEPGTRVLDDEELVGRRTTDVLEESGQVVEPDTVVLDEGEEGEDEFALSAMASDLDLDSAESKSGPGDSALETELDLAAVKGEAAPQQEEEDFFDFSGDLEEVEFELESPGESSSALLTTQDMKIEEDAEEIQTEILDLGGEDEVGEEDLLSEIMEIEEDMPGAGTVDDSADITAEITTMEEPTYEESDLDELLEAEEEAGAFEQEFAVGEEFEVPYGAPVEAVEAVGVGVVAVLIAALVVLAVAGLFVIENSARPDITTGLTSWALSLPF